MSYAYTIDHNSNFYVHRTGRIGAWGELREANRVDTELLFNFIFALGLSDAGWKRNTGRWGVFYKGLLMPEDSPRELKPFLVVEQGSASWPLVKTFAVSKSKLPVFGGEDVHTCKLKIPRQIELQDMLEINEVFEALRRR